MSDVTVTSNYLATVTEQRHAAQRRTSASILVRNFNRIIEVFRGF